MIRPPELFSEKMNFVVNFDALGLQVARTDKLEVCTDKLTLPVWLHRHVDTTGSVDIDCLMSAIQENVKLESRISSY